MTLNGDEQRRGWLSSFGALPGPDTLRTVEQPTDPLPNDEPHEMQDRELSRAVWVCGSWESWAMQAEGAYGVHEAALGQQVASLRNKKHLELHEKGKTIAYVNAEVDSDPEVEELLEEHVRMKETQKVFGKYAASYRSMKFLYLEERKQRRENRMYDPQADPRTPSVT